MCKLRKSISHRPPSVPAPLPTSILLQHLGARILRKIKTKLLLRFRALCWFCLQNLATRALPKFNSCFTLVTYLTDFCVQESSTRGRATTSAPCAYRVVYERLLSPSAPPQIFFCERLPWKLISHSATCQDFRNPVKDPVKDLVMCRPQEHDPFKVDTDNSSELPQRRNKTNFQTSWMDL